MAWLLSGIGLLLAVWLVARGFATADPRALARSLRMLAIGAAAAAGLFLLLTGRLGLLLYLAPLALPLLIRWKYALGRVKAAAGPTPGQTSTVETGWLRLWLDHDSGDMDGEVLAGPFAGRALSTLSRDDLLDLLLAVQGADAQSTALLEAYLDRHHPDWREGGEDGTEPGAGHTAPPPPPGGMSVREACEILGVPPEADVDTIRRAHRRLMLRNHPDRGGSTDLAARINQAKDTLLRHRASST